MCYGVEMFYGVLMEYGWICSILFCSGKLMWLIVSWAFGYILEVIADDVSFCPVPCLSPASRPHRHCRSAENRLRIASI